jgi:hypothetical protein
MATAREELANVLRQARLDAGYTSQGEFAKKLHKSRPVVTRAESPAHPTPADDVLETWAEITGAGPAGLKELAGQARSGSPEWFMPYAAKEAEADTIRCWSPMHIHGLLQTENYSRAELSVERYTVARLAELVKARMERKAVLRRAQVTVVMDEHVLRRCIGSASVMAEQCGYLASLVAEYPDIALHVIPESANMGSWGAFSIASRDGTATVCLTHFEDVTTTAPAQVRNMAGAFDRLLGAAWPCDQTLAFVRTMEEQWKSKV